MANSSVDHRAGVASLRRPRNPRPCAAAATLLAAAWLAVLSAVSAAAREITVMVYNVQNYHVSGESRMPRKDESSVEAVVGTIAAAAPDILLVNEMGSLASLRDLQRRLGEKGLAYPYVATVEAEHIQRICLGILAFKEPSQFIPRIDQLYNTRVRKGVGTHQVPVSRGFLHAVFHFEKENYTLHLLSAHLKARIPHRIYHQSDMRRSEARLLRQVVGETLAENPDANLLVMGDLNDTFNSSPLRTVRTPERPMPERLFDLRPLDEGGMAWTHWWAPYDSYSRIDYALASHGILPEIVFEKTRIPHVPELRRLASDHRPVLVTINIGGGDQPPIPEPEIERIFPNGVRGFPFVDTGPTDEEDGGDGEDE